jgi:hypothetical protein
LTLVAGDICWVVRFCVWICACVCFAVSVHARFQRRICGVSMPVSVHVLEDFPDSKGRRCDFIGAR